MGHEESDAAAAANQKGERVTLEQVKAATADHHFINAGDAVHGSKRESGERQPLDLLTLCVATLPNGYTVVGQSTCADPANYNEELGQQIAYDDLIDNAWPLLGYALREKLHSA